MNLFLSTLKVSIDEYCLSNEKESLRDGKSAEKIGLNCLRKRLGMSLLYVPELNI